MAQPARPRPRPRLVSKQPVVSGETQVANTVNDEDDLFRRNRGRTAQHWRQLEQSAAKAVPFTISDDDWDLGDREGTSSPKPRKKKWPVKQNDRPCWQGTDVARILSSDNEDDDIQIIEHATKNATGNTSPNKRKRERSRSKSITPPPKLTAHQRANVMNLVRQALAYQPRPPSPTFPLDDSTDTIDLDPELAKIAEAVRQRVKHTHIDPEHAGGPESVNIKVRWRPHPLNPSAQEQCWTFIVGRHDTLRELFDEVADLAGVMADQLVINHDHRRVFASGTPHSLHIWAEGDMEACDKHTAEYIRESKRLPSPSRHDSTPRRSPSTVPQSDVESDSGSIGDTIKLVLRSAATKDKTFPLTVRSTTTSGAIVKAFLKAAGLPDHYSRVTSTSGAGKKLAPFPQLMVDGDRMDSEAEIGDADLEDGDLVEIVGL
ncbi:hypothetical protein JVT61DRAFT_1175 [Boletus reticuloceps]|uniref:Rad60/SUMO-like domain-containing protein n=1 Tax=Boletus reticuloceps TaxID=495285 RepID=A0A8I2YQ05_9AGAM|nr:hypothetical protein JVT61DRAFT_1175 [Boletus reticuloceps]